MNNRSAALVIRVWHEGDAAHFRSRVSAVDTSAGSASGEVTVAVVSSPREVLDAVSDWLEGFARDAPKGIDST